MGALKVSETNRKRVDRLQRAIARLPGSEQPLWRQRLSAMLRRRDVPESWTAEVGADADDPQGETDWDLWLANKLDGAYEVVSDRVVEVAKTGASAASGLGFSLWPLAAVALVAWLVTSKK